jgi:glyoxylase-like metal-dependent hydrolase (beta-lactamase superfamily II)
MQLGQFELTTISGGRFRIDGGTMFGVVPKLLWHRKFPADEQNCIPQATNCVLVRTGRNTVLIDTGYGSKLSEKERKIFGSEAGDPLVASLDEQGCSVEEIDTVVLSHLHFDHAGGATRWNDDGELVPTFPNAEYFSQKVEWEIATSQTPELKGAYPPDNLSPLEASGQLRLIDGDVEIVPGIRAVVTGGHTRGHMAVVIGSGPETALFLGDICPSTRHLRPLWCMAYDVDLLQTRRVKAELLEQIADNGWLALFDHDPDHAAGRIERGEKRELVVAGALNVL